MLRVFHLPKSTLYIFHTVRGELPLPCRLLHAQKVIFYIYYFERSLFQCQNPGNANELIRLASVDGLFVGRIAWNARDFNILIRNAIIARNT